MATELYSFEEARSRLLTGVRPMTAERLPLIAAAGRVLATDLIALEPLPRFDHSAMDGYAVSSAELPGEPPWTLPVVGESTAGEDAPALAPGTSCRIFTGAPLPGRADAVVMHSPWPPCWTGQSSW